MAEMDLTLMGSTRDLDESTLRDLYDYPDQPDAWVRANFIASIDGGATADGVTGPLGGPGDRLIFNLLRECADVIVVGAGTVRIEGYSGTQLGVAARQRRQDRGQHEVPPVAIVTRSGRLDRDMAVFNRTEVAPLVLTCTAAAKDLRRTLGGLCDVIDCSAGDPGWVDDAAMIAALAGRGLRRILTEGGPTLLDSFVRSNLLDELCLTIAPFLVGGAAGRITSGPDQVLTRMRCTHILTDDAGYLYTRYVKG